MLIRHLSFFATLAREKHFARTAEICNVTQPTLSIAIRKLENDLGVPLVRRGHRYVGLTPEGEKALVWARQILSDFASMREEIATVKGGLTGALRLGVVPAAMPAIAFLTASFSAAHPGVAIDIQSLTSRMIQRGLDAFDLDAGVTYLKSEPLENVRSLPLYDERYVFVTQKDKPCARANAIAWADAAKEKLCLLSDDMQNRRILDRLAQSIGIKITPPIVCNSFLGVCSHLRCADFASIVPHTFFNVFGAAPDLVGLDLIEPRHAQAIGLVVADRDPASPLVTALVSCCRQLDLENRLGAGVSGH
ncbi:LysR family transcriptional regulator [Methylocystis bryophila]|uniref:LysR family transcriptional regulator n=1 Tax=Methylocystis bryophila TaxID=655015 RepID=A0A1W6MVE1_9HYPH|nr:LysR family transcriptional regulator [Methylocystis bryophila]ARN81554.1 LysR family transcriptional regulator [Methylocystis bryophila]BDV37583.1 LysR family transcriptional regulator [Methylocystis bryophila]